MCSSIEITRLYPLRVREIYRRTVRSRPCGPNNGRSTRSIAAAKFKLLSSSSFSWFRLVNGGSVELSGQLAVKVHSVSEFFDDIFLPRKGIEDPALDLAKVDLAEFVLLAHFPISRRAFVNYLFRSLPIAREPTND